jgi:LPXTG-motif cell wall-anchored protein
MAFDSGGSSAVSIDGRVLNKPSDGYERPVGTVLMYWVPKPGYRKPIGDVRVTKPAAGATVPQLSYVMRGRAKVEVRLLDPRGSTWGVKDGVVRAGTHPIATPAGATAGTWRVEVVAPDYGDRVVKTFKVARKPAPGSAAAQAPSAGAPLVEQPVREQSPAPATATAPAADDGTNAWPWVAAGVGVVALAGAALLLARRRRR